MTTDPTSRDVGMDRAESAARRCERRRLETWRARETDRGRRQKSRQDAGATKNRGEHPAGTTENGPS